eukprot:m.139538 g.139538  ORF g.139538 m.139538 type:complete len:837 (-) comp20312_c0_seq7:16-2526(-)
MSARRSRTSAAAAASEAGEATPSAGQRRQSRVQKSPAGSRGKRKPRSAAGDGSDDDTEAGQAAPDEMLTESITTGTFLFKAPSKRLPLDDSFPAAYKGEVQSSRRLRHDAYHTTWGTLHSKIKQLLNRQNQAVYDELVSFARDQSRSVSSALDTAQAEIPTALLLTGANLPDHDQIFRRLKSHIQALLTPHVVLLRSRGLKGLKAILKRTVTRLLNLEGDGEEDVQTPVLRRLPNFDLQMVETWYREIHSSATANTDESETQDPQAGEIPCAHPPIVLIFQDFELFDAASISDFVTVCSHYLHTLPFVFVFGIASSADVLHRQLDRRAIVHINSQRFRVRNSSASLNDIVRHVLMDRTCAFRCGSRPLQQLVDSFLFQNLSVHWFVRGVNFCCLEHFAKNGVSFLCDLDNLDSNIAGLTHAQLELIRASPSFMAHVDKLTSAQEQRALVLDDDRMKTFVHESLLALHRLHCISTPVLLAMHAVSRTLPEDPVVPYAKHLSSWLPLTLKKSLSSLGLFDSVCRLLGLCSSDLLVKVLGQCETTLDDGAKDLLSSVSVLADTEHQAAGVLQALAQSAAALRQRLIDLQNQPVAASQPATPSASPAQSRMLKALEFSSPGQRATTPLAALMQETTADAAAAATPTPAGQKRKFLLRAQRVVSDSPFSILRKEVVAFFRDELAPQLRTPTEFPLHEIFYHKGSVRHTLEAHPREDIYRALQHPQQVLQCKCCKDSHDTIDKSLPDVCIAFQLYTEASKDINLFDWFQAFAAIVGDDATGKEKQPAHGSDDGEEEEEEPGDPDHMTSEVLQARFVQAITQLQYMGFIKKAPRKLDHVTKLH